MVKICEILWDKYEDGKNMTLLMCIEESLIEKNK